MSGTFFTRIIPNARLRQQSCAKRLSCRFVDSLALKGCLQGLQAQKNRPKPVDLVQMERLELSRLVGTNT